MIFSLSSSNHGFAQLTLDQNIHEISKNHQLLIKQPWVDAVKGPNAIYGCEKGVHRNLFNNILIRETPSPAYIIPKVMDLAVEFNTRDAKEIASKCRQNYTNEFDMVGCVSLAVHSHFKGFEFTGLNSGCRLVMSSPSNKVFMFSPFYVVQKFLSLPRTNG